MHTPETLNLCTSGTYKQVRLESESWQDGDIWACAIQAVGYNVHCRPEQAYRLTIAHQPTLAISSECDLDALDPYLDFILRNRP